MTGTKSLLLNVILERKMGKKSTFAYINDFILLEFKW